MSLSRTIKFTIVFGILSVTLMLYFYVNQRNFTKNHKEFILTTTALLWEQSALSNNILQSSLKTYFNQDIIAQNAIKLNTIFKKLQATKILKNKNYTSVRINISIIKEQLDTQLLDIDRYTMINAGIKNSFLFLSRHIKKNSPSKAKDQTLYVDSLKILKLLQDTKNTLDLDNIEGEQLQLFTTSKDKDLLRSVNTFNAHTRFLQRQLPLFINITHQIIKNDISKNISQLNTLFSSIALNDFKAFDRYALIVILLLLSAFSLIVLFFSKYVQEHKQLIKTTHSLEYALIHDELTGIKNRKSFEREIQKYFNPTILLIDIVDFKNVNDVYGTEAGNKLLQQFAYFLKKNIDTNPDTHLFRLGSDEFCIICSLKTKVDIISYATKLNSLITSHQFKIFTTLLSLQVKIAINNVKPYLENADLALKVLKKDYSKPILFYKKEYELKKNITDALHTIDLIKIAIEEDRIVPYFQPIINLETMKVEKYEALIRIECLDGSVLQPYEFLELSKKSSYYNQLTKVMVKKTLLVAKEFSAYRFSINISMQDINSDQFISDLFEEFDKDLEITARIDIEFLESEDMFDKDKIIKFITRLNSYGVRISIDDFGTGYSNFSYFSDFDVNYLKIDGSITKEIAKNAKKLHILKSIYEFSKGMKISNIAEFVENKEILEILQKIGIQYAQGYYFSKPLPKPLDTDTITLK